MSKVRFLPRSYHQFKDFSRFDDLESWLYTAIDLFGRKLLPWFDTMDESQIVANKERFFFDACKSCDRLIVYIFPILSVDEIFSYAPRQLQVLQRYIDKNNDADKPNYTFMGITLVGMRDKLKFPYNGPFDFQQPAKSSAKASKKHTKEVPIEDEGQGPAIAPTSTAVKKHKKSKGTPPALNPPNGEEVFEEGEAEAPAEENKPGLNADRALSMARKKKPVRDATAKAAQVEHGDDGNQGPLKAVKPEVS